jgi:hypothetical protein
LAKGSSSSPLSSLDSRMSTVRIRNDIRLHTCQHETRRRQLSIKSVQHDRKQFITRQFLMQPQLTVETRCFIMPPTRSTFPNNRKEHGVTRSRSKPGLHDFAPVLPNRQDCIKVAADDNRDSCMSASSCQQSYTDRNTDIITDAEKFGAAHQFSTWKMMRGTDEFCRSH